MKTTEKKLSINNLVIEVTRRCNMSCAHCLRGDAQSADINHEYINTLLKQVDYISSITFTGGEPSLNCGAIDYFINKCKELNVGIGSFYIATNAYNITEDFTMLCLKLYAMSGEKELNNVCVSNDEYHAAEGKYNTELLDGLSFFTRRNTEEAYDYNGGRKLINEGRAVDNFGNGRNNTTASEIITQDNLNDTMLYLNCNGEIINGCDWSYDNQGRYKLCNVNELSSYFYSLSEE